MAEPVAKQEDAFEELGATGLKVQAGLIDEEFLLELKHERKRRTIREMSENDPIIFGVLAGIGNLLKQVDWRIDPASTDAVDIDAAELVETCRDDMSHSWTELISEILTMLPWGFSVHEIVYKRRLGQDPGGDLPKSKFDDGRIGWRKLPIRSQDSVESWIFDDNGGLRGFEQLTDLGHRATLPIEKLGLFRTTSRKNNPEGLSVLRGAFRPWKFKKTIEEVEAIGIERDLAGLPVGGVPAKWFSADATTAEREALEQWQHTVRDLRRDRLEGVVIPKAYDNNGNPLYTLELLSTGGRRSIDVDATIARKNQEIATSLLADFIVLGHEGVGSFALGKTKTELFETALSGILDTIADVFNRHLIPRLLDLNGFVGDTPTLTHDRVESVDLEAFGKYLQTLANIGYPLFPNPRMEAHLAEVAELPPPEEGSTDFTPDTRDTRQTDTDIDDDTDAPDVED